MLGGFVADGDRSSHPGLAQRLAWALQVPIILHLEVNGAGSAALAQLSRTARVIGDSPGFRKLPEAVQAIDNLVETLWPREVIPADATDPLSHFKAKLRELHCGNCSVRGGKAGGPSLCAHNASVDDAIVKDLRNEARCLDFMMTLFKELVAFAGTFYRAKFGPSGTSLTVRLGTSFSESGRIGAKTSFPPADGPGGRQADISIQLPSVMREGNLGQLPYMMFHEIFVHGAEQWDKDGKRAGTSPKCSLREGFVDAAAVYLVVGALRRKELTLSTFKGFSKWLANQIELAHQRRVDPASHGGQEVELAQARSIGHNVFQDFVVRQRGDLAVVLAAALTLLDPDDLTRVRYLRTLRIAATGFSALDPDCPEYQLSVKLASLGTLKPVPLDELTRALEEYHERHTPPDLDF